MTHFADTPDTLLTPAEVAGIFRVDPKTVTRWAKDGKLSSIRTLGGHRRYKKAEVDALYRRYAASASHPEHDETDTSGAEPRSRHALPGVNKRGAEDE